MATRTKPNEWLQYAELFATVGGAILTGFALLSNAKSTGLISSGPTASPPLVQSGSSVWLIGDSIGVGLQPYLQQDLLAYGASLNATVQTGWSITAAAANLPAPQQFYDCILLSLGSNDTSPGANELATLQRLVAYLRGYLTTSTGEILWIWPPGFVAPLTANQQTVVSWFQSAQVPAVPVAGPLPSVASDTAMHLHPTGAGYKQYAQQLVATLTSSRP